MPECMFLHSGIFVWTRKKLCQLKETEDADTIEISKKQKEVYEMAHEILTIKMYELDKKIGCLQSRIQMSELADHDRIRAEAEELRRECRESEANLRNRLRFSKNGVVSLLADAYSEIEQTIEKTKEKLGTPDLEEPGEELSMDERILFAEYTLDFAMQAVSQALLVSMETLDTYMSLQEREEKDL